MTTESSTADHGLSGRNLSVYVSNTIIDYVQEIADELGVTRNAAFSVIIDVHRQNRERRAKRNS